jgi:mono/diheme cytochrome c family protein
MSIHASRLAPLLLVGLLSTMLGACAGPRQTPPGAPAQFGPAAMPGGMMGGPGMRGRGPRGRGCGPGMMRGYGSGGPGCGPGMGGAMLRHRQAMMGGIPAEYAQARNPLPATREVITAGAALYQTHCATCHGSDGAGDGPAAAGLSPPPADLRWTVRRPMAGDGYLLWAISDGGARLGTAMPAFAGALSEQDRWRIIRYLRTL